MSLHTTTVRFTADQWAAIVREAERLGIGRSTFVREAVVFYLGHQLTAARVDRLETRFGVLVRQVAGR